MRAAIISLAFLTAVSAAYAQTAAPPRAPRNVDATTQAETYETTLGGLSRVLGGAHYLRILCVGRGDQSWRAQMSKLMNLEGPPGTPRRAMMAQEFNNGYREQEVQFSGCNPAAQSAELALKARGARYASGLAARYRP